MDKPPTRTSTNEAALVGVDLRHDEQRDFIRGPFSRLVADYDPVALAAAGFHEPNGWFEGLDPRVLFVMLRLHQPRRVIEAGSGWSSLVMASVNQRFLDGESRIICVDPEPRCDLAATPGLDCVCRQPAQDLPVDMFLELEEDDVLFIDSSHVAAQGSDVTFLVLDVLPRLKPGVIVHFHDIFFPGDYPDADWVQPEWNEQYLLQALLTDSPRFRVLFSSAYAGRLLAVDLADALGQPMYGDSFWLRVS
jgi:Methyltransferase domain